MIAVIKSGTSLRNSFYYNENKVNEGVARLLDAVNYPVNVDDTTEHFRLNMLQRFADLNPNVKRPSLHISLNFAPGEQITEEKMRTISQEYMEAIGFGQQPYLLYQHMDAAHPHVHILSLRIRPNGSTIDTFNIGRRLSRPAEQALEEKHNLIRSADHKQDLFRQQPVDATIVDYGKIPTKRAISNVLSKVLEQYKYTSIQELNAVLNLYNISAERGGEGSRTYKTGGLVYRIIDKDGYPVGTPIKASAFASKPTLKYLEKRFSLNEKARQQFKARVMNRIDLAFVGGLKPSLKAFAAILKRDGIDTIFRRSEQGQLYGITYVDHRNKCVFNGRTLGTNYSAKAIGERCATLPSPMQGPSKTRAIQSDHFENGRASLLLDTTDQSLWEQLTEVHQANEYIPYELSGKNKNKKKRKSRNL